jgi:YfiH family protein
MSGIDVIRADCLSGIAHGFLGRRGGVSIGEVAGLNVGLGSGDDPAAIAENRARAAEAVLPGGRLVTVYQVHSPDCAVVDEAWDEAERPHADALVTNRPGLLLGILTADCAPVLFADREAAVIGAAHAGWRGAIGGVIESTVAAMIALGARPERIAAAIGPCIAQVSYEVDEGFASRFLDESPDTARCFAPGRPGHYQFDLEGFVAHRLKAAGITQVDALGLDTYAAPERFFSFRRATHRGEASYGREIALIGLA